MGKVRFLFELGHMQVPAINLDDDQIADELSDDLAHHNPDSGPLIALAIIGHSIY